MRQESGWGGSSKVKLEGGPSAEQKYKQKANVLLNVLSWMCKQGSVSHG